jgi:hypothetical protein
MCVTIKEICHPIVYVIRYVKLSQFFKKSGMSDCVECFRKIQGDDDDIWVQRQEVDNGVEEVDYGGSGGTSWPECKLISEL